MNSVKIAVIDNGIDNTLIAFGLENKVYVDSVSKCVMDDKDMSSVNFAHGTLCAYIIKKNVVNSELYSVRILDENGKGLINSISPALEWCYQNGIRLVNLSLGTTHFHDKNKVREIINRYAYKGMILVAATSNSGYTTYPASFSNVISVEVGEDFCFAEYAQKEKGIDFSAPVKQEHFFGKTSIGTPRSNSYATPYVTAMIANILQEKPSASLRTIRETLCNSQEKRTFFYMPDWIESAWISDKCRKSEAAYYFKCVSGELDTCKDEIDTIIVMDKDELQQYHDKEKHIVYLGDDSIECPLTNGYFWSKEQRIEQIASSPKRISEIQIPIIIIELRKEQDSILLLDGLRRCFYEDGYNAYAISGETESVLYDLEFFPKELCSSLKHDVAIDFIYWQTFYNQSDVILFCMDKKELSVFMEDTDMVIKINPVDEKVVTEIYCDGKWRQSINFTYINRKAVNSLYQYILKFLTEDNDGQ